VRRRRETLASKSEKEVTGKIYEWIISKWV
jgi:hypothetical protein